MVPLFPAGTAGGFWMTVPFGTVVCDSGVVVWPCCSGFATSGGGVVPSVDFFVSSLAFGLAEAADSVVFFLVDRLLLAADTVDSPDPNVGELFSFATTLPDTPISACKESRIRSSFSFSRNV